MLQLKSRALVNLKVYMKGRSRRFLRAKILADETQIPMDDVQELSKLDALLPVMLGAQKGRVTALKRAAEPDSAYQSAVLRIRSGRSVQVGVSRSLL